MVKRESKVTRGVREAVIKTAAGVDRLNARIKKESGPARDKIKQVAKKFAKDVAQKGVEAEAKAGIWSRKAIRTAKDAVEGFKEGMKEVHRKKK